jgi:hypothetical protein
MSDEKKSKRRLQVVQTENGWKRTKVRDALDFYYEAMMASNAGRRIVSENPQDPSDRLLLMRANKFNHPSTHECV